PGKPVSPLTGRCPDRLLFSTRDTRFGEKLINYVYYDSKSGMAIAYPPLSQEKLTELYERHYSKPSRQIIPPDPSFHSPYRNYRGGNLIERYLSRCPSPWWWFNEVTYHDEAAGDILKAVSRFAPPG